MSVKLVNLQKLKQTKQVLSSLHEEVEEVQ